MFARCVPCVQGTQGTILLFRSNKVQHYFSSKLSYFQKKFACGAFLAPPVSSQKKNVFGFPRLTFACFLTFLQVSTKPHGHGDVHSLLYSTGTVKKWAEAGKKWLLFFQDTNPLVFRVFPAAVGVSVKHSFAMNSLTVPRVP